MHSATTSGTQTWTGGRAASIMRDLLLLNADRFPLLATNTMSSRLAYDPRGKCSTGRDDPTRP